MLPNPILRRLGLAENDRAVIFHADDIGMCQATLSAYADLLDFGLLSAAAVMVPCPWFPAAAAFARAHADNPRLDIGVHLTLTSEWDGYRWGPLAVHDTAAGLVDAEGYFHRHETAVYEGATPAAVRAEITVQIERALTAGIDATHIDSHMGSVFHTKFLADYVQAGRQYHLPPLLLRQDEAGFREIGTPPEAAAFFAAQMQAYEAEGLPVLDRIVGLYLDQPDGRLEQAKALLDSLPPGVSYFIIHPAHDTPELRAIAPDWRARVADYQLFTSETWRHYVQQSGVQVVGMRALRQLMP